MESSSQQLACNCHFENSRHHYLCQLTPKCAHCACRLDNPQCAHTNGCPYLTTCQHCGIRMEQFREHHTDCPNSRSNHINRLLRVWFDLHSEQNDSMDFFLENKRDEIRVDPLIIQGEFDIHGDCSICNSQIEQYNVVKPSGCIHCFHENCLNQWVQSDCLNHDKCPDCRVVIGTILKKK